MPPGSMNLRIGGEVLSRVFVLFREQLGERLFCARSIMEILEYSFPVKYLQELSRVGATTFRYVN